MLGIYAYFDKKDNSVVYVGKDSSIEKNKRHREHMYKSNYNKQAINRILQSNPNRYTYQVLVWNVKDQDTLTALEIQNIRQLKPKFNFTDGGDGISGFRHSDETKEKISKSKIGFKHSEETKKKISKGNIGNIHSKETKQKMSKSHQGFRHTEETKRKLSKIMKVAHSNKKGNDNSNSKYNLWDVGSTHYLKGNMFNNNREPNPCKCFMIRWNGYDIPCGTFMDFISTDLINNIIKKEMGVVLS